MSHRALRTFSSNVCSTTLIVSPPIVEAVSLPFDKLSLHFDGGATCLVAESRLLRPSGETDFVGTDVGLVVSEFGDSLEWEGRVKYC